MRLLPKITVITVCYNAEKTITDTLISVETMITAGLIHEYIVIDGKSSDSTLAKVKEFAPSAICISEPDHGIYDAMNKGIRLATGDWIHLLNADDSYSIDPDVFRDVLLANNNDVMSFDVDYVMNKNRTDRLAYNGHLVDTLPHPGLIVKKVYYQRFPFDLKYRFAADIDFMLRALSPALIGYKPLVLVKMATGGAGGTVGSIREAAQIYWSANLYTRWWHCQISMIKTWLKHEF